MWASLTLCCRTSSAPWTPVLGVSILEVQTLCEEFAVKCDLRKKRLFYTWPADFLVLCFLAKLFCHAHINIYYALLF